MPDLNFMYGLGWLPDWPDFRDKTTEDDQISPKLAALGQKDSIKSMKSRLRTFAGSTTALPTSVDLSNWFSSPKDQGNLGSCTANAAAGLLEYFERRAFGKYNVPSRLFLYKTARNLMHQSGDSGTFLRGMMGAMVLFGVPPEEYWPYEIADFDREPTPFCYAFAQNYQAISYYRLDPPGTDRQLLLEAIRKNLASALPMMFGFTVYQSITQSNQNGGRIPMPGKGEKMVGGHAIVAMGYDDKMVIRNEDKNGAVTTGALMIRNSWGAQWGDRGFGWLPYEYVLKGLAIDWWSLLKNEWVDTGNFSET
ncbi:MAG: hypothetical protein LWW85_10485 [Marinilabiliales bacterium]|nr:hypothetical protein [Marinilabiliales bacterium]